MQRSAVFVTHLALVSLMLWLASLRAGCLGEGLVSFSGATMGTRYVVRLPEQYATVEVQAKVADRLAELNKLMSTYDSESELSRFNQYGGADWFAVSTETARVVDFALQVARATDGALDPTVGPLVNLWGFGPEGRRTSPPRDADIEAAMAKVGYQHIESRLDPPALRKTRADIYVDLSSLAKGFAVDEICELLKREGCEHLLVAIGGDIRAQGGKPDGSPWEIGIEEPDKRRTVRRKLKLMDAAVSTSGDWRNAFEHEGIRYSHVIDTKTGRPVLHQVASVTVVADTSMEADAQDTALLVMGDEAGLEWCENHQVAAIFFLRREGGRIIARASTHVAKKTER